MQVTVLGAFEVTIGRVSIVPTAAKPRTLLALLVLRAGHVVPVAELITELWGNHPPRSAEATLQSYISRLRKAFEGCLPGCDPKLLLRTERGGYMLSFPAIRVDADEFERRAAAGLQSFAERDLGAADGRFRDALALWQGRTLDGVSAGLWLATEAGRLDRARVAVQRYRAECAGSRAEPAGSRAGDPEGRAGSVGPPAPAGIVMRGPFVDACGGGRR